ncbi:hypothetical protein OS493_039351, partial [Desmophyllum pertusum]
MQTVWVYVTWTKLHWKNFTNGHGLHLKSIKSILLHVVSCQRNFVAFSEQARHSAADHMLTPPKDILTKESLEEVLSEGHEKPVQGWRPIWALRYSVLVKCRGVIKNKG